MAAMGAAVTKEPGIHNHFIAVRRKGGNIRRMVPMTADSAACHVGFTAFAFPDGLFGIRGAVDFAGFVAAGAKEADLDTLVSGGEDGGVVVAPRGEGAAGPAFDAELAEEGGFDKEFHGHETGVVLAEDGGCLKGVDDGWGNEGFEEEDHGGGVEGG